MDVSTLPRYRIDRSYRWNFNNVPEPVRGLEIPEVEGKWDYCGRPVPSPLAIAAGPLLNGKWVLYYASLGFDILTYKTVRRRRRASYPLPNLLPVQAGEAGLRRQVVRRSRGMQGSWAVSFGMPSMEPDFWRKDIEETRRRLDKDKLLAVSVVASPEPGWTVEQVAEDFARCARWAAESGADCVEANFSCPNVASQDAQLYQSPMQAGIVSRALRKALGSLPLLIKIGRVSNRSSTVKSNGRDPVNELLSQLEGAVDALVMVNCFPAKVELEPERFAFKGESRGIAGDAIRDATLDQVREFACLISRRSSKIKIVGVGGIANGNDVRNHLAAGARAVQLATQPMRHPGCAISIRNGNRLLLGK